MANIIDVTATPRTKVGGGLNALRNSGFIPAVVYGKGRENQNLQVDKHSFTKVINESSSDNILVYLHVGSDKQLALVQDVQHDYLKDIILHVDFHAVREDEEIHASVPVVTVGTAEGEKFGGLVDLLHHSIEVRCLPKDLPESIKIDVSHLKLREGVHVNEVKFPAGVRPVFEGHVVIVHVQEPKVEEAAPAAAAAAAPAAGAAPAAAAPAAAAKK